MVALDLEMNLSRQKDHAQISPDTEDPCNNTLEKTCFRVSLRKVHSAQCLLVMSLAVLPQELKIITCVF